MEPEPTKPQEPEPNKLLEQKPDRPVVTTELEPVELQEIPEPIPTEDSNQHQEPGVTPVPTQGVGCGNDSTQ